MTALQEKSVIPPLKISGIVHSSWAIQTLKTALDLDVFTRLDKTGAIDELANEIRCDKHGLQLLLDALVGLEFLTKGSGKYQLTELSKIYFVKPSPLYMGDYVRIQDNINREWSNLTEAIKTGKPQLEVNHQKTAEEFFPALAAAIFPLSYSTAQMVAEELAVAKMPGSPKVLDLAAGSAVWSIPMVQANSKITVDALDFAPVLQVTKKFVDQYSLGNNYNYISGSWQDKKLEEQSYDIIILGHILHAEGHVASEELVKKCFALLKPGGRLVVAEFVANNDRTQPSQALLFALNMYLLCTAGCVFSEQELEGLLKKSGFKSAQHLKLPYYDQSPIYIAQK